MSDAMIKLVFVIHAREGLDRAAALHYWREVHAPLVQRLPHLVKYVQKHVAAGVGGPVPPMLGIGEIWFGTQAEAEVALVSSEMAAVVADGAAFTAQHLAWRAWVEEHEYPGHGSPVGLDMTIRQ